MTLLLIAVAGGLGSAVRLLVDAAVSERAGARWPWGLLVVNVSGSFALGLLTSRDPGEAWTLVLGVGFLGGYTTLSAASLATARLSLRRDDLRALASTAGMLIACLAAATLGHVIV
ncbi:fluoride efflux transporter FluC [Aeromicrobium sp. CTD01-1L150]|uniref:fluoride efflux transporter FluC n=1 Tax=Aeromicrobium sp. CTD01-1L150 TaxID=3341830 RepID=UPI0035C0B205